MRHMPDNLGDYLLHFAMVINATGLGAKVSYPAAMAGNRLEDYATAISLNLTQENSLRILAKVFCLSCA
jgi:hypothetical protein